MRNCFLLIIIVAICYCRPGLGQSSDTLEIDRNSEGRIIYATFRGSPNRRLTDGESFLKSALRARSSDEFRMVEHQVDQLGNNHNSYQHWHSGLRVDGSGFKLHGKGDAIESMNGRFVEVKLKDYEPRLSESAALQIAIQNVSAEKYLWEDQRWEEELRSKSGDLKATYYPKGELEITMNNEHDWRIAWKFSIAALTPLISEVVWVDAINGEILKTFTRRSTTNAVGNAETYYSGPKAVTTDLFTEGFRLSGTRDGVTIQTKNLNNNDDSFYPYARDFVDNDNNWTAQEFGPANDQVALDAHWALETVFDYWKNVRQRNSIDDNAMLVQGYVHWGHNLQQSEWWGSPFKILAFGDGNSLHTGLTSLDIVAHEFGHGINDFTSTLGPYNEEGALNEGLSDIWGAVIEHWAAAGATGKDPWKIGEETGPPTRVMNYPLTYGFPDTYLRGPWQDITNCTNPESGNDYCGIHQNATVIGKWFFLLSDGDSGTNGNGSCYNVAGIGINVAASIVYQAQRYHMTYTHDYPGARNAMILASNELYGSSSTQTTSVKNAWFAVGVGQAAEYSPDDINGTVVCAAGANITLNNSTDNVSWIASPASLFVTSTGTGHVAFLQAKTSKVSGPATISFTQLGGCTGSTNSVSKTLWVGKPQNTITGPATVYPDQIYTYNAADPYTSDFIWTLNPGAGDCGITYGGNCFFGSGGGGQSFTIVWMHESGYVQLDGSNSCGFGPQKRYFVTVTTEGGCNPCQLEAAYPNPASTELHIRLLSLMENWNLLKLS